MQPFDYNQAPSAQDATKVFLATPDSRFLAGGTNLIDLMRLDVETPRHIIDVTGLPLQSIQDSDHDVFVGALVNNNTMANHEAIRRHFPMVSEAILSGASVQLRNLATTAGNLLQRTRCPYFRDPVYACNKRQPGSGCDAMNGYNRMLAILGTSDHCIASHPSDMAVPLMALDTLIEVDGPSGKRQVQIAEFYKLPGQTPHLEHTLQPGELITGIRIPKSATPMQSTYIKVRDRASYAFALTSAAVAVTHSQGRLQSIRIAFGGIGTIPWRAHEIEKRLTGQSVTTALVQEAASAFFKDARTTSYNHFKPKLAEQTLVRAFATLGVLS